jgi:dTDP-4-amino-4,6-dideoxygalactose transaminase
MFAATVGTKHAIGVGSGTDALKIPLKALDIGHGDEVLTAANTFYASVGAIVEVGATPRFVDCDDTFCLDVDQLEAAITPRTKAIMPIHLTGDVADMPRVMEIAERHGLPVIEDGCQSLLGERGGTKVGGWGAATAFSMHPLKIINVWGDAGVVVTNDDEMDRKVRLLRNHGLRNRDEMEIFGYNSRLDSVQAVVGKWIVRQVEDIVIKRAEAANHYDKGLADIPGIRIPMRQADTKHVYLLYMVFAENRDTLLQHCLDRGIEAKIHYPVPLYQQDALASFGYRAGDFPATDRHARDCISFPVDQHLSRAEQDYVIETVRTFYRGA